MSDLSGAERIVAERARHKSPRGENYSDEDDDKYTNDELIRAAICYATASVAEGADELVAEIIADAKSDNTDKAWPWAPSFFKPKSRIRNLERAGALIAAEIDRLLRAGEQP